MVRLSNPTLMKIASIGGLITCSTGMLYHSAAKRQIQNAEYYKDAFRTLRTHHGAVKLLGEPIKEGTLDLGNKNNYYEKDRAHVEVPVKGSNQKGTLYFWAKRTDAGKWVVQRIELGLESESDRRLLIRNIE